MSAKQKLSPETMRKIENSRTNLKIAIALSDRSATEISQAAGVSVNVVGKFLRNETNISFQNLQAVCDVMGLPMALITSSQPVTPARIRLLKIIDRMSDRELEAFIESEKVK